MAGRTWCPGIAMGEALRQQLLDSSRGRIVTLLRTGGLTADDVARTLGLTRSAVRIQITAMERDGVVRKVGKRPGTTRPSYIFELTPEIEQLLSKAYIPLLTGLVDVFAEALPADQIEALLRRIGHGLAEQVTRGRRVSGGVQSRAAAASAMMNEHLGAMTRVESNGAIVIRGAGCPLAALTGKHKGVCLAMESLVTAIVGVPVKECCDRDDRPQCCFEMQHESLRSATV
jgi:DeoR family transcriptional regulator, suf operon transcriptional repressor